MRQKPSIIVVTGPTASGKTAFALSLMRRMRQDGKKPEMVNVDSVQIYREFDIGSAKPTPAELSEFPSHLFSVSDPKETMDVAAFREIADAKLDQILARGGTPVLVGGTGLYIQVLLNGIFRFSYAAENESAEENVGERNPALVLGSAESQLVPPLERQTQSGKPTPEEIARRNQLYHELVLCDPYTAELLAPSDVVRVTRALNVFRTTGHPLRRLQEEHAHSERKYRALVLASNPPRDWLYAFIDRRVEQMFADGLMEEVRGIVNRHGCDLHPLGALGYRHVVQVLEGQLSLETAMRLAKRDTRRYAKRQLTWWRNQPRKLGWVPLSMQGLESSSRVPESAAEGLIPLDFEIGANTKDFSVNRTVVEDRAYAIICSFIQAGSDSRSGSPFLLNGLFNSSFNGASDGIYFLPISGYLRDDAE